MVLIDDFTGDFDFLSNFYIEPDGTHVEREYQAQKCSYIEDTLKFRNLTPAQAKQMGRTVRLREDWEEIKVDVMLALVRKKFRDHPGLREKLLSTGHAVLQEGNWWGDRFWGVVRGKGRNELGRILMQVRKELSEGGVENGVEYNVEHGG